MRLSAFVLGLGTSIAVLPLSHAVEITGMGDFVALQGRYGPGGDCGKSPRFEVTAAGIRFEAAGKSEQVTTLEFAASYGGRDYQGTSQWFFPFGRDGNYPVLMTFNADEKPGVVTIDANEPSLGARDKALVAGSPYARCR